MRDATTPPRGLLVIRQAPKELPPEALPPRPRPRPWRHVGVSLALMLALLAGGLYVDTTPLGNVVITQAADGDGDLALQTLADPSIAHAPSGPEEWNTSAGVGAAHELGDGGGAGPDVHAPGSAGAPVTSPVPTDTLAHTSTSTSTSSTPSIVATPTASSRPAPTPVPTKQPTYPSGTSPTPSDLAQWANPHGHSAFRVLSAGGYYWWAFGQCTWWAQSKRRDENLRRMGDARYWAANAPTRGYHVGTTPRVGATVVFQPGVQGAGGAGHVAHVEAVYAHGWFLVSEMNFSWNGGGWGGSQLALCPRRRWRLLYLLIGADRQCICHRRP